MSASRMELMGTTIERERLARWEEAAGLDALTRVDRLLATDGAASTALGARNAALLDLRVRLFGSAWSLRSDCPVCGATCEFAIDTAQLATELQPNAASAQTHELRFDGASVRFRLPEAGDLRALATLARNPSVTQEQLCDALLERCVFDLAPQAMSPQLRLELSARMQALEPAASVGFEIACPACAHAWHAPFDIAAALWSELQSAAERTLLEVDALARAYGWSETEILALSPMRRLAYLQLVGAA
jgi:hypothetical protein